MNPERRIRRWLGVASLFALVVSAVLPMSVAAGSAAIKVDVTMGYRCIDGTSPADKVTHVAWHDAALNVKMDLTFKSPDSEWQVCASKAERHVLETGDRITVESGSGAAHLLVVPELTLVQDRVNDRYRGRGPAGDYVRLICGITNGFEPCVQSWKIKVNAAGNWGRNPRWNVIGGDFMSLNWTSATGDKVRRLNYAPHVVVTIGRGFVSGATRSDVTSDVVLKKANNDVRGTATVTGDPLDGTFGGRIERANGTLVLVQVGNLVSSDIASDAQFEVEDIQATFNVGNQRVTGKCLAPAGRFVRAWTFRSGVEVSQAYVWPEENGSFRFDHLEFQSGDRVRIGCDLPTGDRIQKWFVGPLA